MTCRSKHQPAQETWPRKPQNISISEKSIVFRSLCLSLSTLTHTPTHTHITTPTHIYPHIHTTACNAIRYGITSSNVIDSPSSGYGLQTCVGSIAISTEVQESQRQRQIKMWCWHCRPYDFANVSLLIQ